VQQSTSQLSPRYAKEIQRRDNGSDVARRSTLDADRLAMPAASHSRALRARILLEPVTARLV
jgi:hypothetical protein